MRFAPRKTVADRCYVLERGRIMDVLIQDEFANSQRLDRSYLN